MSLQRILAIALGVQLLLVVVLWWPRDPAAGIGPVFDVERADIQRIEVATQAAEGTAASPVVLSRDDDGWKVSSAGDYPASREKVEQLIDSLLALRSGPAIATRAASHAALNVGDDSYGRRIDVVSGEETFQWLVGASTSRSVHLRRVGEDDVYRATGAGEWSFRENPASYYELTFLDADPDTFGAVALHNEHGDLRFERIDGAWTVAELAEGESANAEAIGSFLSEVARVRMTEPVSSSPTPEHGLDRGARIDWTIDAEDQSVAGGYRVGSAQDGERFVKAVDRPYVVRVRENALERLQSAQRADFLQ